MPIILKGPASGGQTADPARKSEVGGADPGVRGGAGDLWLLDIAHGQLGSGPFSGAYKRFQIFSAQITVKGKHFKVY